TSEDDETGGGAVTTTGANDDGCSPSGGGDGASCRSGGGASCWSAGGVSGAGRGVSCPTAPAAVSMPATRTRPATGRGPAPDGRVNILGKVIPHVPRPIQYISRPWERNGPSASPSRYRPG